MIDGKVFQFSTFSNVSSQIETQSTISHLNGSVSFALRADKVHWRINSFSTFERVRLYRNSLPIKVRDTTTFDVMLAIFVLFENSVAFATFFALSQNVTSFKGQISIRSIIQIILFPVFSGSLHFVFSLHYFANCFPNNVFQLCRRKTCPEIDFVRLRMFRFRCGKIENHCSTCCRLT